ncbi:glycoside hydrolase/deacetylase [Basidiobolus meristosporus CBS 931.73]|uniref:Glycoside hydrolase/deacetylase n=1 Tax=Basidiobolus meristosporus CBS 931.73 TaxID=1314790 RepID=A0A1Y1YLS4_9FUNG|nr:glycoside hydrolase/deacetylase [Basidiobolus meristosporus CBS 931.73]|eukprot:ORX98793.1 glycoside hydrolase/deacetylase [Basidiobolus meristosporus CBS 931.73]
MKDNVLIQCPPGTCCSQDGLCGTSTDHCVTNCFSECKKTTPTTTTAPSASKTITSTDGTCGLKNNVLVQCQPGNCCSEHGWCGNTAEYCKGTTPQQLSSGKIEPGQVIETCSKAGTFAVTFDDGPSQYTGRLLDDLKARKVKVTFFIVGQMLENDQGRQFLKRAYDEGHHIASHTYTHISLAKSTISAIRSEMQKTSDAIFKVIGKRPQYMRPPYGEYNAQSLALMKEMGYKVIYWNVDTLDWQTMNSQKTLDVYKKTLAKANLKNDRFISLQHDIQPSTIQAAGGILDAVIKSGFKITTVADCLGDSGLYI